MKKDKKKDNYYTALSFYKKKDYKTALNYFFENIKIFPSHIYSYYYIGRIYYIDKAYYEAQNYFQICYNSYPDSHIINFYLGKSLLAQKESEKSLAYLLYFSRKYSDGNFYLGIAYYNLSRFSEAIDCLQKIKGVLSGKNIFKIVYSSSLYNLGNIYFNSGKLTPAKECFVKSIREYSGAYPSYFQIGSILLEENNYSESLKYFEFLFLRFNKNNSITLTLAFLYNKLGQYSKLESLLVNKRNSFFNPNISLILFKKILAYTLFRNKKYKEAIPLFIQIYQSKDYDINILFCLAQSRFWTNEVEKSLNVYKIIFDIGIDEIKINNFYLYILLEQKRYEEAHKKALFFIDKKYFDKKTLLYYYYSSIVINDFKNISDTYINLRSSCENNLLFLEATALYHYKLGDYSKAIKFYFKLYTLNPTDRFVIGNLIDIFMQKDMRTQAEELLEQMYKINPSDNELSIYYGFFLINNSNLKKAIMVLNGVDNFYSSYLLSDTYFRLSENKKAFYFLKKSFFQNPLYLPIQYKSLRYFYRMKKSNMALKLCKLMKKTNPDFNRVLIYEALIYIDKGRFELASENIINFLNKNKKSQNLYFKFLLSVCLFKSNKIDESLKIIRYLIKIRGKQAPYLVILSLCNMKSFDLEKQKSSEKNLKLLFGDSPSYKEYKSKYLSIEEKTFNRNDIGIRIP